MHVYNVNGIARGNNPNVNLIVIKTAVTVLLNFYSKFEINNRCAGQINVLLLRRTVENIISNSH